MMLSQLLLTASGLGAAYVVVAAAVAHRFTSPFTRGRRQQLRSTSPELHAGCTHLSLRARVDGTWLSASLADVPNAPSAVVLVHGRGTSRGSQLRENAYPLVEALNAAGFAVLLFDLRGHGDSASTRITFGIREQRDILGAFDWLRERGFSPGNIGVLGASMGGAATIAAAAIEPGFGAIVIDSAYTDVGVIFARQFARFTRLPTPVLHSALVVARWLTGESIADFRPLDLAHRLRARPTLVIHAQGDSIVPVEQAHAIAAAADGELWLTGARGHLRSYAHDRAAYLHRVVGFFARHVGTAVAADAVSPISAMPARALTRDTRREVKREEERGAVGHPAEEPVTR